jgi:GMP synthase (glutamine-hydrolysing)
MVTAVPRGFELLAHTESCPVAAMGDHAKRFYGVQFHPEVAHTTSGMAMLRTFAASICGCETGAWKPAEQIQQLIADIREKVGRKKVFFFVSGGVDSTVAFTLCLKALGPENVEGVFVDTGLMRDVDVEDIGFLKQSQGAKIHIVDARTEFIRLIGRTYSPETKRKLIGKHFVEVHERILREHFRGHRDDWMLGQGTIYPDTIESGGTTNASTIKTHHNRVGTILRLLREGRVIEPLSQFYKDEVRQIGRALDVDRRLIGKQPFPGPGLAIRCITSRTNEKLVEDSDVSEYARAVGFEGMKVDLKTVGVKGDERSYEGIAIIAGDGDHSKFETISTSITNNSVGITRVLYLVDKEPFDSTAWRVKKSLVTAGRIEILKRADTLVRDLMQRKHPSIWETIWQFPVILVPLVSSRSQRESIVLRPVNSVDGMTASFANLSMKLLYELQAMLESELGVQVFLDITNKPPATIEWE